MSRFPDRDAVPPQAGRVARRNAAPGRGLPPAGLAGILPRRKAGPAVPPGPGADIPSLIDALAHSDALVASNAAVELGRRRDPNSIGPLFLYIGRTDRPGKRLPAVVEYDFGESGGGKTAVNPSRAAEWALDQFEECQLAGPLCEAYLKFENGTNCVEWGAKDRYVQWRLGCLKNPTAIQACFAVFQNVPSASEIRCAILMSFLTQPQAQPYLTALVQDPRPLISKNASAILAQLNPFNELAAKLDNPDPDASVLRLFEKESRSGKFDNIPLPVWVMEILQRHVPSWEVTVPALIDQIIMHDDYDDRASASRSLLSKADLYITTIHMDILKRIAAIPDFFNIRHLGGNYIGLSASTEELIPYHTVRDEYSNEPLRSRARHEIERRAAPQAMGKSKHAEQDAAADGGGR